MQTPPVEKKEQSLMAKILLLVLAGMAIAIFGFISLIIAALAGGERFFTPYLLILGVGLELLFAGHLFQIFSPLHRRRMAALFLGGMLVLVAGHLSWQAYLDSIPKVDANDVKLWLYEPHREGTMAASLDKTSTLKLDGELPRLDGATALYPVYAAFAQAVYPKAAYDVYKSAVICTTTPQAYDNLIKGEADIIFCAGPSKAQQAAAELAGVELILTPIGREAFVFFVNSRNPVTDLTSEQIRDIYAGDITRWRDVGGGALGRIRPFQRPEGSGSQTMLLRVMGDRTPMTAPTEDVVAGMGGIIEQTADYRNHRNAIGYSFLFFATELVKNDQIRLLSIDGVAPTPETIRNGSYPLGAPFYAITTTRDNPDIDAFLQWMLSPQGQSLVEATGYTPIH